MHVMKLNTPPLNSADAEAFGRTLGQYAIEMTALGVTHILPGGKRRADRPLTETIKQTAGMFGAAGGIAPAAIPLLGLLPWLPIPAILLGLAADIRALHGLNKRTSCPPAATGSEVTFRLSGVSERRLGWAQYLIGGYCQLHGWDVLKAQDERQVAAGRRYAQRHGALPPAWGAHSPNRPTTQPTNQPTNKLTHWLRTH